MISIKDKAVLGLLTGLLGLSQMTMAHNNGAYNHDYSAVANNPEWMSRVDGSKRVSELSLPGTHDSMSIKSGDIWQNQTMTLMQQLDSGVRVFDMRTRHINDGFRMHHGIIAQDTYFDDVLSDINNFLEANPSETVLFRLRSEHSSENNTRSYEETLKEYLASTTRRYTGSSDNPSLDEVRGQFVILQEFSGADYGIPYGNLDKQDDYSFSTNWDLHDKWTSVKNHLNKSKNGSRDTLYMNYLSGAGGSMPYFVSSGHSSPGTSAPRLATGLTTPGWNSSYPDFPRTTCFIGICTISFEGTNVLTADYIANGGFAGMVMADFPGKRLIDNIINLNDLASLGDNSYYNYGNAAAPVAGNWNQMQVSPDALVNWDNGKTYAFVGDNYYRIDNSNGTVDSGYPYAISGNWGGHLGSSWTSGIDAAVQWKGSSAYFFKGSQYIGMNMDTEKTWGPKSISAGWPGLTGEFAQDIDAAINWGNGKIYFFKGDQYMRYDISSDSTDSGYPAPIAGNWSTVTGEVMSASKGISSNAYFFK